MNLVINNSIRFPLTTNFLLALVLSLTISPVCAQTVVSNEATASTEKYTLRYKLRPGESLVSRVIHFAETRTTMAEHEENSSSRTTTEKVWEVQDVSPDGEMTFEYRINSVDLAQSVGDAEELKYNSLTDQEVPSAFSKVAETIAKPLATITINGRGQVIARDNELQAPQLGIGELTIPLPEEALAMGAQWSVPRECRVKLESGAHKTIKVRELYTLQKVSAGVATIRIETQPLTPVADPAVDAQLIQQLSKGEIKFDLDQGRMLSTRLDWSDVVVGFRGADTSLRYDAKYTEELVSDSKRTASRTGSTTSK
jgi:hypothetical protein